MVISVALRLHPTWGKNSSVRWIGQRALRRASFQIQTNPRSRVVPNRLIGASRATGIFWRPRVPQVALSICMMFLAWNILAMVPCMDPAFPAQYGVWSNRSPIPSWPPFGSTSPHTNLWAVSHDLYSNKYWCILLNRHWEVIRYLLLLFHSRIIDENRLHNHRPTEWERMLVTKETDSSGLLLTLSPVGLWAPSYTLLNAPYLWPTSVPTARNPVQALIPLSLLWLIS